MAIALFNGSYGLQAAGFRVRILEESTAIPAVITLQDGTVVNSDGEAVIDAYGNLSVYLDTSKTYGVHLNQYKLPASDTSTAIVVKRTALQLASTPSLSDFELGSGATFVDIADSSKIYRISNDGTAFIELGNPGGITTVNGLSNALLFLYQRATSAPTLPNLPITYTFATSSMTGLSQGWLPSVPAGTDPIWVTSATASSSSTTDVITPGEWVTPVVFSQNGINSSTVQLFQRTGSSTPPSAPDVPVVYTFASGIASGLNNGWTQTLPTSGGGYRWTTTGTALATSGIASDVINPSEWAPVSLIAQDGANGPAGMNSTTVFAYQRSLTSPATPSATTTYTFSTNSITGLNNGWTQTIPSGTSPLWVSVASATSATDTDSIAPGEWATPVILVQNGADGATLNTATLFLYQRTTTSTPPSLPSAAVTYTFSTAAATGITNGWTQTLPVTGGGYRWLTTATALSSGSTDLITPAEWAAAAVIAQDGATGATGASGTNGTNGAAGLNNAVVLIYQRSATGAPTLPSATITYTFATAAVTGLTNGWTATLPTGTDPIYVASATASSNTASDTIASNEWATPIVLSQNGTNGINAATVYLFQRTATSTPPSVPSGTVTYTFATGVASNLTNSWTQSMPTTGGSFRWVITATALSNTATDTIAAAEWATPAILAQDGATGTAGLNIANVLLYQRASSVPAVPSATVTYTFATSVASGLTNSWTQTIPAGTLPLYVTSASASSAGTTDTIGTAEWATPVVMSQNGADGLNSATVYLFQRTASSSAPALPTGTITYTFSTGIASGLNNGWTQSMPTTGGSFRWLTLATALSTTATDTIASTEWVAAALLAQDGATGTTGTAGQRGSMQFYVALSGGANTWSDTLATTAASVSGGPILNDTVTEYNNSVGYSQTKYWNGTNWILITQVIDGSLLVSQSVSTPALAANSVTATQLAANSVTASKILAVGQGKALNSDPACMDLSAWVAATGSLSLVTNVGAPSGLSALALTASGSGSHVYSKDFPIVGGRRYKISVLVKNTTGTGTMFIRMYCTDATGTANTIQVTAITPGSGVFEAIAVPTAWTQYIGKISTGVAAVQAHIELYSNWSTGSGTTYITDFRCEEQADASLIVDGSITATQISATAGISAGQIDARGLSIKDASGNVILSAGTPLANQITAGSGNLYQNGDFALSLSSVPSGFVAYSLDATPTTNSIVNGAGAIGAANLWRLSYSAASTTRGNGFRVTGSGWNGFQQNVDYVITFYAKVNIGTHLLGTSLQHVWNNAPTTQTWLQNPGLTTAWQRYVSYVNFGASTVDPSIFIRTISLINSGDQMDYSCFQIETGTAPSGFAPLQYIDSTGAVQGNPSGLGAGTAIANSAISLGGRNLLTRTAQLASGGSVTTDYYGQSNALSIVLAANGFYRIQGWTQHDVGSYSVSFWIKTSVATTVEFDLVDALPSTFINTTTSWQFMKFEGLSLNSAYLNDGIHNGFADWQVTAACTLYLSNIMLETGNKCSNWTAAPEDAISKDLSNAPSAILNNNIGISPNGTLTNAGGGQVTIGGLGYTGALNATADLVLVGRVNCVTAGNSVTKVGGSANWDSDAYSTLSYTGGAFVSAIANWTGNLMFGLNSDPLTDSNYTSLDYAFYLTNTTTIEIRENGFPITSFSYVNGDNLVITYDGIYVTYYQNNTQQRKVAVSTGQTLYFDSSFYSPGAVLSGIRFGPMTDLGPTNVLVNDKISKTVPSILSTTVSMNAVSGAGFVAGNLTWDASGNRTGGNGVAITPGGIIGTNTSGVSTFTLNAATGDAYFGGVLKTGIASTGQTSGSVVSTTANASSTSTISTGVINFFTYNFTGNDLLIHFDVNASIQTNTNTPCRMIFIPVINGTTYSPFSHFPCYFFTMSQSGGLGGTVGGTSYNWGATNSFPITLYIPSGGVTAGSKTIGFYVKCDFYNGSGTANIITGSSMYVEGIATVREFRA